MYLKNILSKIFIFLFLFATLETITIAHIVHAAIRTVTGTVTKVSDGDTIHLKTPEQTKLRVRLYGIDAPEAVKVNAHSGHIDKQGQPYGLESWGALECKVMGKNVKLEILDIDKYKRMVGIIWLGDRNINLEMVEEGFAEAFVEYLKPPYRTVFMQVEQEAKSSKLGIWSLQEYERPRDFRKRLKLGGSSD